MKFSTFIYIYVAGGLTFIPLLLLCALIFAYFVFTKPVPPEKAAAPPQDGDEQVHTLDEDLAVDKSKVSVNDPEVTAAYFAVCREYVPGGINGKPPERSTPAGEVLIAESPSVYQSMYRSIFERGKTQIPTIEGDKKDGKAVKKARNVFFVVMRHGHLMLYDDSEQLEVRHVISLTHHSLDLYGGGDPLTEGDLWIKRNCIRLTRKPSATKTTPLSKPFYLFSDNCSEKEDFYHALLQYQAAADGPAAPPPPKNFETQDILKLVQQLHSTDSDAHTRWLNAMIGRIFLAMYKTDDIENFIRAKINRKISRVPKPNFITSIQIQDIDMGDSAPIISNPRLKEMNVNGDTTIEFDIKYSGGFKLQMGAVARIDLGSRLKAREVNLIMAGTLRKLTGHMLVRIKPPPSNRMWMTFETMPQLELSIEPIVSSRQITYGIILRAIESRIREVMGETIVLPNWDDSPFLDTSRKEHRGGVYETNPNRDDSPGPLKSLQAQDHALETVVHELVKADDSRAEDPALSSLQATRQKTLSMPSLFEPAQKLSQRKSTNRSVVSLVEDVASTTCSSNSPVPTKSTPAAKSPPLLPARKPKPMRSSSFASAATTLVSTEGHDIEAMKPEKSKRNSKGAVDFIKEVNTRSRSQVSSPNALEGESGPEDIPPLDVDHDILVETPDEDEELTSALIESNHHISEALRRLSEPATPGKELEDPMASPPRSPSVSSIPISVSKASSISDRSIKQPSPSPSNLSSAATAAKKWGLGVLNRQSTHSTTSLAESSNFLRSGKSSVNVSAPSSNSLPTSTPNPDALRAAMAAERAPMGRGYPLPPPGTPLPGPTGNKSLWSSSSLNLSIGSIKRKPVTAPALPPRKEEPRLKKSPPPLPARRRSSANTPDGQVQEGQGKANAGDSMLVVSVPDEEDDSLPSSPTGETLDDLGDTKDKSGGLDSTTPATVDKDLMLPDIAPSAQLAGRNDVRETFDAHEDTTATASSVETLKLSDTLHVGHSVHDHPSTTAHVGNMDHSAAYSSETQWSEQGKGTEESASPA